MSRLTFRLVPAVILLFAGACGSANGSAPGVVVRDSAGITIVETARTADDTDALPRPADEPELSIGLVEGDPRYLFGSVAGAARLPDGTIVVGDEQAQEIRYYSPTGTHLRTVGRRGEGPGEYSGLIDVWRCGGARVFADDYQLRRVTVLGADGTLERSFPVLEPESDNARRPFAMRCGPNGGFIAAGWGSTRIADLGGSAFYVERAPIWLLDEDGAPTAVLGEHVVAERVFLQSAPGRGSSIPHPLGRRAAMALGAERAYVGPGTGLELFEYDLTGRHLRTLRGPQVELMITPELLASYDGPGGDRLVSMIVERAGADGLELPSSLPAFDQILLNPGGEVWVRRFRTPRDPGERWGVFGPDGAFLGHVAMPAGFALHEVGDDYLLGVGTDGMGVERVQLYRLLRGAGGDETD